MFLLDADMTCLRQGDVIEGIPFPRLAAAEVSILGEVHPEKPQAPTPQLRTKTHTHRDDPHWMTAQVPVRLGFGCVITQCCDLEPRNNKILTPAFAVARLIAVPKAIEADPQRLASLRQNKDPRNTSDPGYVNLFYVPTHQRLLEQDWVVDYNQLVSIPGKEFPAVLSRKVLQMDDGSCVKFKIKLAISLARLTDDEREAGLENPWAEKQDCRLFPK